MKVLIIDPHQKTVTEVEHPDSMAGIYKLLHCEMIEAAYPPLPGKGDLIYVDEEGLLGNLSEQAFFLMEGYPQPLAGYGMVLNTTRAGNDAAAKSSAEDVAKRITWMSLADVRKFVDRS